MHKTTNCPTVEVYFHYLFTFSFIFSLHFLDFYEDVLAIMVTATLYQISPLMWNLFYLMYEAFERDGYDFFTGLS
jgi:hypothetical protein